MIAHVREYLIFGFIYMLSTLLSKSAIRSVIECCTMGVRIDKIIKNKCRTVSLHDSFMTTFLGTLNGTLALDLRQAMLYGKAMTDKDAT